MPPPLTPFADDAAVAALGLAFLERRLPKAAWTHAGHFAAAIWLLRCRPDLPAQACMPGLIRAYNLATGVANTDSGGFHATITAASIAAAADHMRQHPNMELAALTNALLAGPCGKGDWLLAYWRKETLFSVPARRHWVAPDRAALPFACAPSVH